jgi:hypothetical protein
MIDINAIHTAFFNRLNSSPEIAALGAKVYQDEIPEKGHYPAVVYFLVSATPRDTFADRYWEVLYQVDVYAEAQERKESPRRLAGKLAKAVTTTLDNAPITPAGHRVLRCRFDFMQDMTEGEGRYARTVLQYRLTVGQ